MAWCTVRFPENIKGYGKFPPSRLEPRTINAPGPPTLHHCTTSTQLACEFHEISSKSISDSPLLERDGLRPV